MILQVTDLLTEGSRVCGVKVSFADPQTGNPLEAKKSKAWCGGAGHWTQCERYLSMLLDRQIPMEQKAFAVGLRIQHPQKMINLSQYGREDGTLAQQTTS